MATTTRTALVQHHQDFEWAASQYRCNHSLTVRNLADMIGVTRDKLFNYFSQHDVKRDLGQAIQQRTQRMLADSYVAEDGVMPASPEDIISINATMQAALIREHRDDIRRMRKLAMQLLTELEGITVYADVFEDLGELLRKEDDKGVDKLNDAYKHVISLPGRTETLKKLGDTLKIVIMLERQAFGMRDDYEDGEIRKSKVASSPQLPQNIDTDFHDITKKFMKVLNQTITDVT